MPRIPPHPDVKRFLDYCRIECGLAANTICAYEDDLKQLDLTSKPPTTWTSADVSSQVATLTKRGLCSASVCRHLYAMRRFFRFIGTSVADDVPPPRKALILPRPVPDFIIKKILAVAKRDERLLIELMYGSGLRIGEAVKARLEGDMVRVVGKGGGERIVPCNPFVQEHLPRVTRRPSVRTARRLVKAAAARAGVQLNPHQLRHSFATVLLRNGCPIHLIQAMMGHSNLTTTAGYIALDDRQMRETIEKYHPRERTRL